MEAIYSDGKTVARVGHIVSTTGLLRGIVIGVNGTFVKTLGIGTSSETGDTVVLPYIRDCPASDCHYMEKQTLNL